MGEQLKFFKLLSLKEIARRRVVTIIRSNVDISASVSKFHVPEFDSEEGRLSWLRCAGDEVVEGKAAKLELPESLKKELFEVVRPINLEVERWKHFLKVNKIILPNLKKLVWTTAGQIDYQKTAEGLVNCGTVDVVHCYRLACLNCLEDDIPLIWEKMTEEDKKLFICVSQPALELTACWSYIIKYGPSHLDYLLKSTDRDLTSFNQWAFEHSAVSGNEVATKYFFQKLTYEERESSLVYTVRAVLNSGIVSRCNQRFRVENLSDVFCYLMSLLTPQQRLETIQVRPGHTLRNFFFCPRQDLFLLNAGLLWSFVPVRDYPYVAGDIILRYKKFCFDFPKFLPEFILESPADFKKYLGDTEIGQHLGCISFNVFLGYGVLESIKAMLRELDAVSKVKFVLWPCVIKILCCLISKHPIHWPAVEMCLREASLSEEEKSRMKAAFETSPEYLEQGELSKSNFKKCFEFLDKIENSVNDRKKAQKRKLES